MGHSRSLWLLLEFLVCLSVSGATLEKLVLEDMARKSTEIVKGRVLTSRTVEHGAIIFTEYTVSVAERWKGAAAAQVRVAVPGGTLGAIRQSFSGTPAIEPGAEYVFFLWTGRSGLTQIIGLSQGLFDLSGEPGLKTQATRAAIQEPMLNPATGELAWSGALRYTLTDLRERVRRALGSAE